MDTEPQSGFEPAPLPGRKSLLLIIIVGVVLLAAIGGFAWWYFGNQKQETVPFTETEEPSGQGAFLEQSGDALANPEADSAGALLEVPKQVTTDAEIERLLNQVESSEAQDEFDETAGTGNDADLNSF